MSASCLPGHISSLTGSCALQHCRAEGLKGPELPQESPFTVTVPGAPALWEDILQAHGKLTLAQVCHLQQLLSILVPPPSYDGSHRGSDWPPFKLVLTGFEAGHRACRERLPIAPHLCRSVGCKSVSDH